MVGPEAPRTVTVSVHCPVLPATAPGQYQTPSAVVGNTGQWTLTVKVSGASGPTAVSFSFGVH